MNEAATSPESTNHPTEPEIVLAWWRETIADRAAPTGPRAELRRARTLEEVFFAPLFHELRRRLSGTGWRDPLRLALVAGVLAHVKEHAHRDARGGEAPFARQMAAAAGPGDRPRVSPARFRRLLRVGDAPEDRETLFQLVRRAVRLMDGTVNVTSLAESLYWWGPEVRKRWALEYYQVVNERAERR